MTSDIDMKKNSIQRYKDLLIDIAKECMMAFNNIERDESIYDEAPPASLETYFLIMDGRVNTISNKASALEKWKDIVQNQYLSENEEILE